MSKLYVVNCTGQQRQINYRMDYTVDDQGRRTDSRLMPYRSQLVPARQQMQLGGDWYPGQIEDIVQQLEATCGAVNAFEIKKAKTLGVVKLVWQLDRPVAQAVLKDVVDHNVELLSDQGAARRRQLALAADTTLGQLIGADPTKMELEFEQVEDEADFGARLTEGLRVKHRAPEAPAPKRSRRRAA